MADAGLEIPPGYVRHGPHVRDGGAATSPSELVGRRDRADRDLRVVRHAGAGRRSRRVRTAGLGVPGDVSVVGFDDVEVSGYVGLTTVRQPLFESGSLAADAAARPLDDDEVAEPLVHRLDLELVERSTTAPPKKSTRATGGAARMKRTVREDR